MKVIVVFILVVGLGGLAWGMSRDDGRVVAARHGKPTQAEVQKRAAGSREQVSIGANHAVRDSLSKEPKIVAAPWSAERNGSTLTVGVGAAWCTEFVRPHIHNVNVIERRRGVVVTVYVAYPFPQVPGRAEPCASTLAVLSQEVELARPLKSRRLVDGVRWPPIVR